MRSDTATGNSSVGEGFLPTRLVDAIQQGLGSGSARIVKRGADRAVVRLILDEKDLHVKCFDAPKRWRRWNFRWWPSPAEQEYRKLQAAAVRAITAPRCLGFTVATDGRSYLVTETASRAVSLMDYLQSDLVETKRTRWELFRSLGRFLAQLHAAGVRHTDLHPGNLLVEPSSSPRLLLVDFGSVRLGKPLTRWQTIHNLALLNRWFILRANRTDRLRCWLSYQMERTRAQPGWQPLQSMPCRVEHAAMQGNRRLWRRWSKRCLSTNRRFEKLVIGHAEIFRVRGIPFVSEMADWCRPQPPGTAHRVLKHSRSSWVAVHELVVDGQTIKVILKWFRGSSVWRESLRSWWPTTDLRAWINGHSFRNCLIPTPKPLLLYRSRTRQGSLLVTDYLDPALHLRQCFSRASPSLRRQRLASVARLIRTMHERGWANRDLKAGNILLRRDENRCESAWIVDLAGAWQPICITHSRRKRDLARLNASFHDIADLTRTDRLRFLRGYLRQSEYAGKNWKRWWESVRKASLRKIFKNARRGRPLA